MSKFSQYFSYLIRHKFFVFVECLKFGLIWQGLVHDWSKFLPDEFLPYVEHFYGSKKQEWRDETGYYKPTNTGDPDFDVAWLKHQHRNPHHWQYWVLREDDGRTFAMKIPENYLKEMICDWRGAGRAQGTPNTVAWYEKNRGKMLFHEESRELVEEILYE
jgi:hypothetical protein